MLLYQYNRKREATEGQDHTRDLVQSLLAADQGKRILLGCSVVGDCIYSF